MDRLNSCFVEYNDFDLTLFEFGRAIGLVNLIQISHNINVPNMREFRFTHVDV